MATATVSLSVNTSGLVPGGGGASLSTLLSAPIGEVLVQTLASGNNSITVPSGSSYVLIQPPSANTVALVLKGVNGDTGVSIHPSNPFLLSLASSATSFVINAASATTGSTYLSFY